MNCESQVRDELYHHGILGMKWGVRRAETKPGRAVSIKALANKGLAANARGAAATYNKLGNKTLASMQTSEAKRYAQKAEEAQKAADAKKAKVTTSIKVLANKGLAANARGATKL